MMAQCERQLAIRDYISDKRVTNYHELMHEFGISKPTLMNDLAVITPIACFVVILGMGGGSDGWYSRQRYFTPKEYELMIRVVSTIDGDDVETFQGILAAFGRPQKSRKEEWNEWL